MYDDGSSIGIGAIIATMSPTVQTGDPIVLVVAAVFLGATALFIAAAYAFRYAKRSSKYKPVAYQG